MSSEVKANKLSPATGTDVTLGDASDTFTIPASATLDVNGTLDLAGSTMTGFTIPSGQTLTVASGGTITNSGTATGFGGDNTPAFAATLSATQTVSSSGTWTKVEFDSEIFDSDSCYDSSTNYRFTPTTAGKYFVYGQAAVHYMTSTMLKVAILKNGSIYVYTSVSASNSDENYGYTGAIINFNGSTDYVEFYILQGQSGITPGIPTGMAQFGAFKVIT